MPEGRPPAVTEVTVASLAVSVPMGQQSYESHLVDELPRLGCPTRHVRIRSLRASIDGDRRLPLHRLGAAPLRVQHLAAVSAYGRGLVHRTDLRIPAARGEVLTVHDLAPLHFPEEGSLPPTAGDQVRAATALITGTRAAAEELRATYGVQDVSVIPHGVDPAFFTGAPLSEDERMRLGLPRTWVLHAGGASRRKNLAALAACWPAVRTRFPDCGLVLCGPPNPARTTLFSGLPGTFLLGRVEPDLLVSLLRSAAVLVVPSTYEGFGLPALEGMAAGVPVVAARSAALSEVCGQDAIVVEPTSEGLTRGLDTALRGTGDVLLEPARRRARRHTWRASASAHLAVYQHVRSLSKSRIDSGSGT